MKLHLRLVIRWKNVEDLLATVSHPWPSLAVKEGSAVAYKHMEFRTDRD